MLAPNLHHTLHATGTPGSTDSPVKNLHHFLHVPGRARNGAAILADGL